MHNSLELMRLKIYSSKFSSRHTILDNLVAHEKKNSTHATFIITIANTLKSREDVEVSWASGSTFQCRRSSC